MFTVFRKPIEVARKDPGRYIKGYWQEGKVTKFTIYASVQGVCAEVLQTMPEGARTEASYTLRTETKLLTASAGISTPDIVIIDGQRFLVTRVTPWQNLAHTRHYEVIVVRENTDGD